MVEKCSIVEWSVNWVVCYSGHALNYKLLVQKFAIQDMAWIFTIRLTRLVILVLGCVTDSLNSVLSIVCLPNGSIIQMLGIQITSVFAQKN